MKSFYMLIFYLFLISGLVGGNFYWYEHFFKNNSKYISKDKIIYININKLINIKKQRLINKYKKEVLTKLKNKNILSIEPDSILDKETLDKIKKDLNQFNIQLNDIINQLKNKGYIIFTSESVLGGIPDATNDIKKILNLSGGTNE